MGTVVTSSITSGIVVVLSNLILRLLVFYSNRELSTVKMLYVSFCVNVGRDSLFIQEDLCRGHIS